MLWPSVLRALFEGRLNLTLKTCNGDHHCGSLFFYTFILAHINILVKFWFAEYINYLHGDMGAPFQAHFHEAIYLYTFCRHGIYPSRHARAILMCLTLLNSFNLMKSFTMFIFSWLKFVKKRGTSIYLWRVYVMPYTLCIHRIFLLWHNLERPIFYEGSRIIEDWQYR